MILFVHITYCSESARIDILILENQYVFIIFQKITVRDFDSV